MKKTAEIRLEDLLGCQLLGGNNQPVGRIEEFRAQVNSRGCVVTEVVIGMLGLLERFDLGARLVIGTRPSGGCIARWDQIDFSDPSKPRLTVDVSTLDKV
jgi:hypothetical protein